MHIFAAVRLKCTSCKKLRNSRQQLCPVDHPLYGYNRAAYGYAVCLTRSAGILHTNTEVGPGNVRVSRRLLWFKQVAQGPKLQAGQEPEQC